MQSARARIGDYIRSESGFRRSGMLVFGTLFGLGILWQFGALGGPGWWLFLVAVSYGAGWVWAFLMWQVMKGDVERIKAKIEEARKASASPGNGSHSI